MPKDKIGRENVAGVERSAGKRARRVRIFIRVVTSRKKMEGNGPLEDDVVQELCDVRLGCRSREPKLGAQEW